MPKIPGVNHLQAVRALEKAGRFLTIPRADPVNAYTMGGIVRDAGLTVEQFKKLL